MNDLQAYFYSRRTVLKLMALGTGAVVMPGFLAGCGDGDNNKSNHFPQSVASGDPRESSVILWTRVVDSGKAGQDLAVTLEVATDEAFTSIVETKELTAAAAYDGCVKVRVEGLSPYTYYYYRFKYGSDLSRTGRTKTAPTASSDVNVKFAYVSCQDYIGKYYNSWAQMLSEDNLDFIVHLGDYIYETTGDPTFQNPDSERKLEFADVAGAIQLGHGDTTYYAANSVSNYRDLYKTYRSDEMLQAIHERFPMIAIWDDHEYSDDCHGATATYTDGLENEYDIERRHNAERVFFEFMPIEVGLDSSGVLSVDSTILYDEAAARPVIYRDFSFGQHMHLVLTDYRTFRPDHLIPEDAFPGTVVMDKETLQAFLPQIGLSYEALESSFGPYVNVDDEAYAAIKQILLAVAIQGYMAAGFSEADSQAKAVVNMTGKLSSYVIYSMLAQYQAMDPSFTIPEVFTPGSDAYNASDKGLAYLHMNKTDFVGQIGTRYMGVKDSYDLYSAYKFATTNGASENCYGDTQLGWIQQVMTTSPATWIIYASSVSLTPMLLDLRGIDGIPEAYQQVLYLNLDQMDGFKNFKEQVLLPMLRSRPTFVISGDIHATFVSDHKQASGNNSVFEITGTSISSGTFMDMIQKQVAADETLSSIPGIDQLVLQLDPLLLGANQTQVAADASYCSNVYADSSHNGYVIMDVESDNIVASLNLIHMDEVGHKLYDSADLASKFSVKQYQVKNNTLTALS